MKVLVCGASGFIGRAVADRLTRAGHQVVRGVRQPSQTGDLVIDYTTELTAEQWLDKLRRLGGVDVVVNAVGIIVERGRQTFDLVHAQAPIALFTACRMQDARRVVQISALGAESRATPYFASKCAADDFLLAQSMPAWVIRPALVYGADGTSARMFRVLASFPVHALPAGGYQALQPIHVDDLADLVARLLDPGVETSMEMDGARAGVVSHACDHKAGSVPLTCDHKAGSVPHTCDPKGDPLHVPCIDAVGAASVTWRDMLAVYRRAMGFAPACAISLPAWIMRCAAGLAGRIPGSVLTPDTWRMLQRGNTANVEQTMQVLGRAPRGIETFIEPDGMASLRAQALAAWRGWVLRMALALVWVGSAFVSAAAYPRAASFALLDRFGLHGVVAGIALYGACALDFGLGLATLLKPGRRLWLAQMALILAYSAAVSVVLPEFLIEPFGPILKNAPILVMLLLLFNEEVKP